jgi:iron complex transport system permease protein
MMQLPLRYAALLLALCASIVAAVVIGPNGIGAGRALAALGHRFSFNAAPAPDLVADQIVWLIRLPRVLLAMTVGAGLSAVGVAMQTLVRNPLADPYVLGLSGGASAGASLFYLGFLPAAVAHPLSLPLAAFLGGLATVGIVYTLARESGDVSVIRLLLAGVAMSALTGALTTFVTFASPELEKWKALLFWLMGSFAGGRWADLPLPAAVSFLGAAMLVVLARPLDALLLGDEAATSLGVSARRLKQGLLALCALVTGVLVATAGAIGFVGLIVPHAVRVLVGVTHRRLVPACVLAGALFMAVADTVARLVLYPAELPIGVVTALCGVPFFLYLIRRKAYRFG